MELVERHKICENCKNRTFHNERGWLCILTDAIPDFEIDCDKKEFVPIDYRRYNNLKHYDNLYKVWFFSHYQKVIHFLVDTGLMVILYLKLPDLIVFFGLHSLFNLSPIVILLICYIFYFFVFEYVFGRTIGQLLTNACVVDQRNRKPDVNTLMLRTILRLNPLDVFTFFSLRKEGWHDRFSGTKTISSKNRKMRMDDLLDDELT
jgi:hypothetical protein